MAEKAKDNDKEQERLSRTPTGVGDIPLSERWAPIISSPDQTPLRPGQLGRRLLAAAVSLVVLALFLWAIG